MGWLLRKLDETLAALEPWRRAWFDELRVHTPTPTVDAAANGSTGEEDEADRRQANKALAAGLATAAFPLDALERITHHGDRPVDSKLITAHEDIADALARLDPSEPPDSLLGLVAQEADLVLRLLRRNVSGGQQQRLETIAVGSFAQAGFMAFRLDDRISARRFFAHACSVAEHSGDDTLRAQALAAASILCSPIPQGGQGGDTQRAVAMMDAAADHARRADDGTRVWVGWWLAMELAAAGDERGFRRAVEAVERISGRSGHTDARGFFARFFAVPEPAEVAGNMGASLVLLGHGEEGADLLGAALVPAWPRWTVGMLANIAAAWVLQGEPDAACAALTSTLDLALDAGYPMGIERIRGVCARFPANWAGLPCVQELDKRLRRAQAQIYTPC